MLHTMVEAEGSVAMSRSTVLFIRGIFGLMFGILAITWPGLTILALVTIFACYALLDGIATVWAGLVSIHTGQRQRTTVVRGLLGIAAGVFTLLWPGVTTKVLLLAVAAWAIVTGALDIVAAIRLRKIADEWMLVLSGALSVALGVVLFTSPAIGLIGIASALGVYSVVSGIMLIGLALRVRRRVLV
jgi:uncharacterized membrane protein HdeD (DUF308 family)